MKKNIIFISTFLLFIAAACAQTTNVHLLSPAEFKKQLALTKNATLLDVRQADELKKGKINGALNLNFFDKNFQAELAKLDKTKPIFVYCAGGYRSGETCKKLQTLGFTAIYDLDGGYDKYAAEGLNK
jgi:rhodanese-related sulfurtransferase